MDQRVAEGGVVSHREIGWQRPGSRGPDYDVGSGPIDDRKLYINALTDVVAILDFSFRQGRAAGYAPINRLLAAIDKALLDDVGKEPQFVGFVFLVEGQIRFFPFPKNPQAFKLLALNIDVFARIGVALFSNSGRIEVRRRGAGSVRAVFAHLLGDFELDRETVAIPAWNIRSTEAAQRFVFDDYILENLIQRVADVDITVSERRAVVQNELFGASALGLDAFIKPGHFPLVQPFWLPGDQIGLHREIGSREIQCVLIIHSVLKEAQTTSVITQCQSRHGSGSMLYCVSGKLSCRKGWRK